MEHGWVTASSHGVQDADGRPIVVVAYAGRYPPGAAGNRCAAEMAAALRAALTATGASAVILDFRDLDYAWGDAIGGLAFALREQAATFRPAAIVANGATAAALAPLLAPNFVLGALGIRMFGGISEAVDHVRQLLAHDSPRR